MPSLRKSYDLFFSSAMLAFAIVFCFKLAFVAVVGVVFLGVSTVIGFSQKPGALRELPADLDEAIVDAAVVFVLTLLDDDVGGFS